MAADLPDLTVADVRDWTVDRYYERGESYFHEDRIRRPQREGRTLTAYCRGSRPSPYRVEIQLGDEGIVEGTCSCPIGDEGRCKHAVALLLTWIDDPDGFAVAEPLSARLKEASREQLVEIIRLMIDREPTLASVVDLTLNHPMAANGVEVQAYVEDAFDGVPLEPYEYGYAREVAEALDPLLERGHEQIEAGNAEAAASLFAAVAEAVRDRFDAVADEDGALLSVLATCGDGLGTLLAELPPDADPRDAVVEALLALFLWNVGAGGVGADGGADRALRSHTTDAERARVADRLREHLPAAPDDDTDGRPPFDFRGEWTRQHLGGLLLALERDRLNAEAYVDLCRRTGHWAEAAERLLALDRIDDAVAAARRLPDHKLDRVLDRLVAAGAADRAQSLAADRLDTERPDPSLRQWLYEHARDAGDDETALSVARAMFRARPSPTTYDRVRRPAQALGRWADVRPDLLAFLDETNRSNLRVRLHLRADEVEAAMDIVEPFAGSDRSIPFGVSFLSDVADAVREARPDAARVLYEECARRLVAERGRPNYRTAADLLVRAKSIYEHKDAPDDWQTLIDAFYEDELHRLPAARDEFQKRDLL